jgi:anthranilate synthase/aminodeoxychorismate synthase-like glutamine amidotransferase
MILVIDNYDSFVFNLVRYLEELGQPSIVRRNDEITLDDVSTLRPSHILISPGPCSPNEAGISNDIIYNFGSTIPILGVCLGHQCIGQVYGGVVKKALRPVHGKVHAIVHNQTGIFQGLPSPLSVTRYHSLIIEEASLPDCLEVTARTHEGEIMAVVHKKWPVVGVQFHPEAVLTEGGHALLANFLKGQ